jgi:hypothetical protein
MHHAKLAAAALALLLYLSLRRVPATTALALGADTADAAGRKVIKGHVISQNQARWTRTAANLRDHGIAPVRVRPVPLTSAVIQLNSAFVENPAWRGKHEKFLSLKLSHRKAVLAVAHDDDLAPGDWGLIFEDDVAFHASLSLQDFQSLLQLGLNASADAGFAYLGLCEPRCSPPDGEVPSPLLQRCAGACSHAYAVTKRRAMWFYDEVESVYVTARPNARTNFHFLHWDQQKPVYFEERAKGGVPLPFLIGAGLHQEGTDAHHLGAVFQDRAVFPTLNGVL